MTGNGSLAIVTGASRGIGRAIALQLACDGHDIAFCYRQSAAAAQEVAQKLLDQERRVFHRPCDVTDFQAVKAFVEASEAELGQVGVLINCAGIIRDNPLVLMKEEDWQLVIDTNLNGYFNFCRSVVFGFMKRKQGVIVNISSVSGVHGNPRQSNYSAAKAGIIGFSRALAKELATYNIRVNVVAPGFINTDMTASVTARVRDEALASIPLGRFGEIQDVADAVSFLVSDRAKYITGQVLQVDGGIIL